jgi:2',3'-cyclic-nucleotide 2'-phosphodiesterase (5'-nucleotidase family)
MIPMNPPISTVELTGEEIVAMLEENLERTFARDPYGQMGGYVKRSLGLNVYLKIENPPGQRIQQVFVGNEEVQSGRYYPAAFVTEQGVAHKYGRQRKNHPERAIDAMRAYLAKHRPLHAELKDTFVAV